MDLFAIIGATLRRWYLSVPVVALAGLLAWQAYHSVEPVYSSTLSVSVLPPVNPTAAADDEQGSQEDVNPYSGSGGARFAAVVLARNLNGSAFQEGIGLDDESTATIDASASDQEPIIKIEATASTPEETLQILEEVTVSAGSILSQFQADAGATEGARYRTALAVPPDRAEDITPSRFRTAGALAVIGLGVAAALATALDMVLERRGRGRGRQAHATTATGPAGPETDDPEALEPAVAGQRPTQETGEGPGGDDTSAHHAAEENDPTQNLGIVAGADSTHARAPLEGSPGTPSRSVRQEPVARTDGSPSHSLEIVTPK